MLAQGAMIRQADFDLHIRRKRGGQSQPRAKNFEDQRVAHFDQLHATAEADAQCFEALHLLIIGRDAPDNSTDARRELIQPNEFSFGLA